MTEGRRAGTASGSGCRARPRPSSRRRSSRGAASSGSCRRAGRSRSGSAARSGRPRSPPARGGRRARRGRAARRRVLGPAERVLDRAPDVEVERVAELVRLRRLLALPAPAGPVDPMAAERVARQPGEQVVEDLLADPPAAPRRQLQPIALARQVAGLLELAGELVERLEVAGAVGARAARGPRRGRAGEVAGDSTPPSWSSSASSAWSWPIRSSAGSRPSGCSPLNS